MIPSGRRIWDPQDFDEEDQDLFLEEEDEEDDLPEEDSLEQAGA